MLADAADLGFSRFISWFQGAYSSTCGAIRSGGVEDRGFSHKLCVPTQGLLAFVRRLQSETSLLLHDLNSVDSVISAETATEVETTSASEV